jgi:hypothetical protein
MKRWDRLVSWCAILLGFVGVVVCAAAIGTVCWTGSRLTQSNERVFNRIDGSLTAVRDRVLDAKKRVQESQITTKDVGERVRNWTQEKTSERLAIRLEVEKKAGQLADGLRQADVWLETSEGSILGIQQVIEVSSELGARIDAESVGALLEKLGELRRQLKQSTATADSIRETMAKAAMGEQLNTEIAPVAQFAVRMVATLAQIDTRLEQVADRVSDTQTGGQNLKSKTHFYIITAETCAVLFIAWMAAGQVCMCRYGWANQRHNPSEQ